MIGIIQKTLVLITNNLDYLKDNILKFFLKKYKRILFLICFLILILFFFWIDFSYFFRNI